MVRSLALALLMALAPVKEPANLEKTVPALPGQTLVLSVDGDYRIEGERTKTTYESLKSALDERFSAMFAIKEQLCALHDEESKLRDEYYALKEAYDRELKKIIAAYVVESNYGGFENEDDAAVPMPLPMHRIKTVQ